MEKQLQHLTDSAMSYKSIYAKSAAQMAREAMEVIQYSSCVSLVSPYMLFTRLVNKKLPLARRLVLILTIVATMDGGHEKMMRMSHLGFIVKHKHNGCVK